MSQHDMDIANQAGAAARADINAALVALASNNSGSSAPTTTFAYQSWADIANDTFKIRNAANTAWISLFTISTGKVLLAASATDTASKTGTGSTYATNTSPTFIMPILGVASATSLATSGLIKSSSPTAGIGYDTGAGSTSSAVARGSTVTNNNVTGRLAINSAAYSANSIYQAIVVNNSSFGADDCVYITGDSSNTTGLIPSVYRSGTNQFAIFITTNSAGGGTTNLGFTFVIIKAASA